MIGDWIGTVVALAALAPAGLRWLRVSQREHYLPDATSRFAWRWWLSEPANASLALLGLVGLGCSTRWPLAALAPAGAAAIGPLHLALRGRSARLVATARLRRLAALWLVLEAILVVVGILVGAPAPLAAAGALGCPVLVDLASAIAGPIERRLLMTYVRQASDRLSRVRPTVVAVTGSYGKTSTKNHIAHLVAGARSVVASPASFNNRAGLARAVNEQLVDGTEVFVAEMGTYGPGEIAELCRWFPPQVAVITAVGPVHLERFGSEDAIARAKSEITERASTVVLNMDDRRLAALADRLALDPSPKAVIGCSAVDLSADVCVQRNAGRVTVHANGVPVAKDVAVPAGVHPLNLACAVAVALHLNIPPTVVASRLKDLPPVPNRLTAGRASSGVVVLDDTFNANPAGARAALAALTEVGANRRVVVTPGMVELGPLQDQENEAFGAAAVSVATDFVVVGRTNRRALVRGAHALHPVELRTREEAVRWVRTHLGTGDAVLYENDLPDHYP